MTTDPHELPGADKTGSRAIDPVTGYETTGHDWGGITELNTPFPKIVLVALALTFVYSMIAWVLLPSWPLVRSYLPGVLGLDQGEMARVSFEGVTERRSAWLDQFASGDFAALAEDAALMATALPAAHRLFLDNCAMCHGQDGAGGPGFPALNSADWMWGGTPEDIAVTLQVGINAEHPDTRWAEMPAFEWMDRSERLTLSDYVADLPTGNADHESEGATLFDENCAACHNDQGAGGFMNGAPSLVDHAVIYGQDVDTVMDILLRGRQGIMPHWSNRLSDAEINLLALYTARLSGAAPEDMRPQAMVETEE
ncbi:cytochrome-c oxidase, cbb3-type subunit III [Roseinatronobacter sp. S2]|uniref:cytochrome-c oxidase, cbb3-type subunit III n=1 Tax=Roseinatronobacter sp. S2 TaxID=3035471 RepID=UPI00240F7296|nr:cytochrome-c oxidase, cbb3-type subunit III [Roseinatronobacter sp. S2]WFE77241.1 cytochrome-c oxidase, cbb3-type subunit III [Roseinatronobacter sp. S2]